MDIGSMKSDYASVTEQAGIYAGEDGYDIRVEDDTHLKGAVIASTAEAEKNRLTTGTLTMEDIENKADYDVKGIGVSYNHFATKEEQEDNYNETGFIPNLMPGTEKKTGTTTRAAISAGTIITTKEELDIEKINRDTADSLRALEKIFDKDKIEERQELAKLFAKNADELLHKYDRDGTFEKALAHGIVAEITSQIAGNEAGAGFAAGFTNELLIKKIDKWAKGNPEKAQWISAALGATVNSVIGENGDTGAAVAQYGIKWNLIGDGHPGQKIVAIGIGVDYIGHGHISVIYEFEDGSYEEVNYGRYGELVSQSSGKAAAIGPGVYAFDYDYKMENDTKHIYFLNVDANDVAYTQNKLIEEMGYDIYDSNGKAYPSVLIRIGKNGEKIFSSETRMIPGLPNDYNLFSWNCAISSIRPIWITVKNPIAALGELQGQWIPGQVGLVLEGDLLTFNGKGLVSKVRRPKK